MVPEVPKVVVNWFSPPKKTSKGRLPAGKFWGISDGFENPKTVPASV